MPRDSGSGGGSYSSYPSNHHANHRHSMRGPVPPSQQVIWVPANFNQSVMQPSFTRSLGLQTAGYAPVMGIQDGHFQMPRYPDNHGRNGGYISRHVQPYAIQQQTHLSRNQHDNMGQASLLSNGIPPRMLIQNGQQVFSMHNHHTLSAAAQPDMVNYSGGAAILQHSGAPRFAAVAPPISDGTTIYGMMGAASQRPHRPFYPPLVVNSTYGQTAAGQPMGLGNAMPGIASYPASAPQQKRKRVALAIVDPETNKEVDVLTPQSSTTNIVQCSEIATAPVAVTADEPQVTLPATIPMMSIEIAAQFAAQVAATLTPLTSAGLHSKPTSASFSSVSALNTTIISEIVRGKTETEIRASSEPAISRTLKTDKESTPSELALRERRSASHQVQSIEKDSAEGVDSFSKGLDIESSSIVPDLTGYRNIVSARDENSVSCDVQLYAVVSLSSLASSAATSVCRQSQDHAEAKDAKKGKKKKVKDLNDASKGHGTDMDAYIDHVEVNDGSDDKCLQQAQDLVTTTAKHLPSDLQSTATVLMSFGSVIDESKGATVSQQSFITNQQSGAELTSQQTGVISVTISDLSADKLTQPVVYIKKDIAEEKADVCEGLAMLSQDVDSCSSGVGLLQDEPHTVADVSENEYVDDTSAGTDLKSDDMKSEPLIVKNGRMKNANTTGVLKYNYSEDQWSPLRPEGKKQYDRSFLLQLQHTSISVPHTIKLATLDCVLTQSQSGAHNDRPTHQRQTSLDPLSPVDFTPGFIKSTPSGSRGAAPRRGGGGGSSGGPGSTRKDARGGGAGGGRPDSRAGEGMMGGGSSDVHGRRIINIPLQQDIQLHTTENAWKAIPSSATVQLDLSDLQSEDLYKKVRGILNKLTPQKFETLLKQVQGLPINSAERLDGCIHIVFEKAISEPNFSVAYAHMARRLSTLNVPTETNPEVKVSFRVLLLNRCQAEFEKDKQEETDIAEIQRLIDDATTEEKRAQLTEEKDMAVSKAKRRSLGLIRFIGELFKLKMLTEGIMHECLKKLLRADHDEDSLECLCQLLNTIGLDIDQKQSQSQALVNGYFKHLKEVADRKTTSARLRFMILDVIDLRKNEWVPRRVNNNPKTIEQIHRDAEQEQIDKKIALEQVAMEQRLTGVSGGQRGGGRGQQGGWPAGPQRAGVAQLSDDGWTAVSNAPRSIIDPSRMKLTKQDENISLGPGGGRPSASWTRGAGGGGVRGGGGRGAASHSPAGRENERPTSLTPNRFSALTGGFASESLDSRSLRARVSPGGGGSPEYRGRFSGPYSGGPGGSHGGGSRSSQDYHLYTDHRRSQGGVGSHSSRTSPLGSPVSPLGSPGGAREPMHQRSVTRRESPAPNTDSSHQSSLLRRKVDCETSAEAVTSISVNQQLAEMTDAEVESKTKSIMDEYLQINDIKEATDCVNEELSRSSLDRFVFHVIVNSIEKSAKARHDISSLLSHLLQRHILTASHYVEGLRCILQLANELVIDICQFWQCLASLLAPMIHAVDENRTQCVISLIDLRAACSCLEPADACRLIALVLKDAAIHVSPQRIAALWQESALQWSDLIPADRVPAFISEYGLEFTLETKSVMSAPSYPMQSFMFVGDGTHAQDRIQADLNKLFQEKKDCNQILNWIQTSIEISVRSSVPFVRALCSAICSSCLEARGDTGDTYAVDDDLLKSRLPLLKNFIKNSSEFELQALFALQSLVHKLQHPSGVLLTIFNTLYDEELISEETFYAWRDNNEPSPQGKGVAVNSVKDFFQFLADNNTNTDSAPAE